MSTININLNIPSLETLADAMCKIATILSNPTEYTQTIVDERAQSTTGQVPSEPVTQTDSVPTATINGSVPEVPDGAIPEAPAVPSTADIQKAVVRLAAAGKKVEVREIVKGYADRVSGIPEDKRAEVLARLSALEG